MKLDAMDRLRDFARTAREAGDAAGMCRVGVFNEVRGGSPKDAKGWFTLAAGQAFVPALHQLARIAVREGEYSRAQSHLSRIALMLATESQEPIAEVAPLIPPKAEIDPTWVLESDWVGEAGWVGVAPDVLGKNMQGQDIPFDWTSADTADLTGNSFNAEALTIITPDPDLALAVLEPVVDGDLGLLNMDGEKVASFDEPFRIKLPRAEAVDGGVSVSFDARGEVPAPLGRAIVKTVSVALRARHVPAHIANLNPFLAELRY